MREFIPIPSEVDRLVLTRDGRFRTERVPLAPLEPGDVLFRLRAVAVTAEETAPGVYGDRTPPGIPVGEPAAVGDEAGDWQPLDRALILRPPILPNVPPLEGLSSFILLPEALQRRGVALRLPREMPAEDATLIPAAAAAARILREARVPPGGRLLVIGLGLVGQILVLMARHQRVDKILAADPSATLRRKAAWNGAMTSIVLPDEMVSDVIAYELGVGGVHAAVVLTPDVSLVHQALGSLTARGTLILGTALPSGVLMGFPAGRIQGKEFRIQGVARFEEEDIDEALKAIRQGIVNGETLISRRIAWEEAPGVELGPDYWEHGTHVVIQGPE